MFFLGGRGTTGGLGARLTVGFGVVFCTVTGDSTLFLREIAGDARDDGVDGEDLAVLGPKYFIRSTSLDFLRVSMGEPSTLDTDDGVALALGLVVGAGFALGKYLARLTPCKADTSLFGSCFGFASTLAPVKNLDTSFSLLTPTIRGPSTADLIDCMLLLNFCASTFFMRRSSAA
uniref:(northern house mosquito) hypothetical protein n=1 Tax=Culex pipiens TaxID=7175 RepID=A0A8D8EXY2_CULPI